MQSTLCGVGEVYFIEPEAVQFLNEFRESMSRLSLAITARNDLRQHCYENVCPQYIATSQYMSTAHHSQYYYYYYYYYYY